MKKISLALSTLLIVSALTACGTVSASVDINYSDNYVVEDEKLSKYESLSWSSSDESIASVNNGTITGKGPGQAVISAKNEKDKTVAEYSVNVKIVPVTNIVLSTNNAEVVNGNIFSLSYTLFPDNASDYGIVWKSADSSVAEVNERGEILAKKEGQTTISASNTEGVMATCSVLVKKAAPDFAKIYSDLCSSSSWCSYGDDYLSIDTNINDIDDFTSIIAYSAIKEVNKALGLPDYVYEEMGHTTAMQGKQTYEGDGMAVTWSYHPDRGLEVTYKYTGK